MAVKNIIEERHLRLLADNIPQKVFVKDRDSVYVFANSRYAGDLKIDPNEITGKTDYDFYPRELAEKYRADDKKVMDAGNTVDIEEKYVVEGREIWVHTVKTPVADESGNCIGIMGVFSDVTGFKKQEDDIQRLAMIVESSDDAIIGKTLEGVITDWNRGAEKLYGYTKVEVIGKKITLIIPHERIGEFSDMIKRIKEDQTVEHFNTVRLKKDGRPVHVSLTISPIKDGSGKIVGASSIGRDITAAIESEEKLKNAQKQALLDLAVPVAKIWDGILLLPLIGMLDSERADLVMQNLLSSVEQTLSKVVIIDISGIPVVDTLVARHLVRTVSAIKLMGAECIITGIKPRISQTIVQMGIDLSGIMTKSTLSDGLKAAFNITGQKTAVS